MNKRDEIVRHLLRLRAPSKVARVTGYALSDILPIADELAAAPRSTRQEVYDGYGRPELKSFFVARKRATEVWDNDQPEIAEARQNYEAGTHEMCSGRDGDWIILYSIPRKKRDPRPDYFLPEF